MQETKYREMSEEELHEMLYGTFAQENKKRTDASMIYLHDVFLREFYREFPGFYNYILQSKDDAYLMEDL
jgi:hypothetical protein